MLSCYTRETWLLLQYGCTVIIIPQVNKKANQKNVRMVQVHKLHKQLVGIVYWLAQYHYCSTPEAAEDGFMEWRNPIQFAVLGGGTVHQ